MTPAIDYDHLTEPPFELRSDGGRCWRFICDGETSGDYPSEALAWVDYRAATAKAARLRLCVSCDASDFEATHGAFLREVERLAASGLDAVRIEARRNPLNNHRVFEAHLYRAEAA